jgi:hypothetical protein
MEFADILIPGKTCPANASLQLETRVLMQTDRGLVEAGSLGSDLLNCLTGVSSPSIRLRDDRPIPEMPRTWIVIMGGNSANHQAFVVLDQKRPGIS